MLCPSHLLLEEVDSTNKVLQGLLVYKPVEGTSVQAYYQTAGKGQAHNVWFSAKYQNLLCSWVFYPEFLPLEDLFYWNKAVSLAVLETVRYFAPELPILIKWPNDVLVNTQKIAGILIENSIEIKLKSSIVGIGLNVNQVVFDTEIAKRATSLKLLTGQDISLEEVHKRLTDYLRQYYAWLKQLHYDRIDRLYLSYLQGYQEQGLYRVDGQVKSGTIIGVYKDGRLAVEHQGIVTGYAFKEIEFVL